MSNETDEPARHKRLVEDAVARGQAAVAAGDKEDAARWLDRAHRLVPADGTIALLLASVLTGRDNPRAVKLFRELLASHDVRDGWFGLTTALLLMRDVNAAGAALAELLSRHVLGPNTAALADRMVRAAGSPGWCGLTSEGVVVVHAEGAGQAEIRLDGESIAGNALPAKWPRARQVTVMTGSRHLVGSPISLRAIGRVEGHAEAWEEGLRGWAWCPGDPDADPRLAAVMGRTRLAITATDPAEGISGLAPFARPRAFSISWAELPVVTARVQIRGRDGQDLQGSPITKGNSRAGRSDPVRLSVPYKIATRHSPVPRRSIGDEATENIGAAVILVTHDDGGGVERRVQASADAHSARGRHAIVLCPFGRNDGATGVVVNGPGPAASRFELPRERAAVLRLLRLSKPIEAEVHHLLNHDESMIGIIRELGVPYEVHTHDFAWFCPRIALVGRGDRYCGEPAPNVCEECIAEAGHYLHEDIRVTDLLRRSRDLLAGAKRVIAPSHDAAQRMTRHFPNISLTVVPHEDDDAIEEPPPIPPAAGTVRVVVAGAIGLHKGFHVLLACARDASQRGLDLTFIVAGSTIDDQRLIDTGKVFVTGPYSPDEAVTLIRAQNASMAFLPSIWPETWCLGLTELWRAGLRVAAFDIGAPAERISRTGRGFLMPLGLSPGMINDALLNAA